MTDQELTSYATEFRRAIIGGSSSAWWCAAISAPLSAALDVMGVPTTLAESDLGHCNHIFILLQDGRVLDPTADQFNWCSREELTGVYLGPPCDIHQDMKPYGLQLWGDLMREFKRLCPEYGAGEVGGMVRVTLTTFPSSRLSVCHKRHNVRANLDPTA